MIEVRHLAKNYGRTRALQGISFDVGRGEIVGFLGPNGAGKSTTMRILTGYLPPTSGTAKIAGYDVVKDSLQAREHLGYMPENVPLYPEMRVREYLLYRAALKGLRGRRKRQRLMDVLEICGLTEVEAKLIGTLSKGYRQRVGLADALIHDPELLILDEPTIGLDPNQIRQVRTLIQQLARHHTVLLSTHILSEVEMVCHRALIIHRGKIAAADSMDNLRSRIKHAACVQLEIRPPNPEAALEKLKELAREGLVRMRPAGGGWHRYEVACEWGDSEENDLRPTLAEMCLRQGWPLRELSRSQALLEEVFAALTDSGSNPGSPDKDSP